MGLYVAEKNNYDDNFFMHQFNHGEFKVGGRRIPVDGYEVRTKSVFQFHGCFFHGHKCRLNTDSESEIMQERRKRTAEITDYLVQQTDVVKNFHCIYECEWRELLKSDPIARRINSEHEKKTFLRGTGQNGEITEADILNAVKKGPEFFLAPLNVTLEYLNVIESVLASSHRFLKIPLYHGVISVR